MDVPINFEADWAIGYHGTDTPDLFNLLSDEGLTPEAWVNRHH